MATLLAIEWFFGVSGLLFWGMVIKHIVDPPYKCSCGRSHLLYNSFRKHQKLKHFVA